MKSIKVIKNCFSNIDDKELILDCYEDNLKEHNNYFELINVKNNNRIYIDIDGSINDIDETKFNEINELVIDKLETINDISLITSSHYASQNYQKNTLKNITHKLSYRIVYINEYTNDINEMKDIVIKNKYPILKELLKDVINIDVKQKENSLNIDVSVYRNGKMRCVNAYKNIQQKERINKLIKGSILDTFIGYIDDKCKKITVKETVNETIKETVEETVDEEEETVEEDDNEDNEDDTDDDTNYDTDEFTNKKMEKLIAVLGKDIYDDYNNWIKIGILLKNININLKETYINFSKQSRKFDYMSTKEKWESFKVDDNINKSYNTLVKMCLKENEMITTKWIRRNDLKKYIKLLSSKKNKFLKEKELAKKQKEQQKLLEKKKKEEQKEELNRLKIISKEEQMMIKEEEYRLLKKELEKRLCLIENPLTYMWVNDSNEVVQYKEKDIHIILKPYGNFLEKWQKDIYKRKYDRIDFQPNSTNKHIYNMFRGFKHENNDEINYELINPFLNLISDLMDGEEVSIKSFLDWCAWIRQRPEQKTEKAVIFYSDCQGVGKNTFFQLIEGTIGYSSILRNIEELKKNFNNDLCHKLIIRCDEIDVRAKGVRNELKNFITNNVLKQEKKGVDSVVISDYSNFMATTNNKYAFHIEPSDRRFYPYDLKNIIMSDEKASELYGLLKNPNTFKSFDTFLKTRQIPDKLPRLDNKYRQELIQNSLPSYIQMIYKQPRYYEKMSLRTSELYEQAISYAKSHYMEQTFSSDRMSKDFKKEFGEYFVRGRTHNYYEFPEENIFIKQLCKKRSSLVMDMDEE
jgi:hypothetical protein